MYQPSSGSLLKSCFSSIWSIPLQITSNFLPWSKKIPTNSFYRLSEMWITVEPSCYKTKYYIVMVDVFSLGRTLGKYFSLNRQTYKLCNYCNVEVDVLQWITFYASHVPPCSIQKPSRIFNGKTIFSMMDALHSHNHPHLPLPPPPQ